MHAISLAPGHQVFPAEAAIRPEPDFNVRPLLPEPGYDPGDFLLGAGGSIDVGGPELGEQQLAAAENVKRQIAVALVVAVEEAALLIAVDRIVRGVQIEDQPSGRFLPGLNEQADEQPFHGVFVHADFMVALSVRLRGMFQPVERGLACEHGAIGAAGFELAGEEAQHRIVAQGIVIVQVLIAKRNAVDALGYERFERVLDILLAAGVAKAGRNLPGQADDAVCLPQQQRASI
jgi:hypothetical protein